jgi:hypothetical protein
MLRLLNYLDRPHQQQWGLRALPLTIEKRVLAMESRQIWERRRTVGSGVVVFDVHITPHAFTYHSLSWFRS